MARGVSVPRNSGVGIVAGLAAYHGGLAQAARATGIGRGTLDGIISGRHGMGEKTRGRLEAYLNDRAVISSPDAKLVKDLGRSIEYTASGRVKSTRDGQSTVRSELNRLKNYSPENKRKEVSFFVARQKELAGFGPQKGGGGGGGGASSIGGSGKDTDTDAEWFAEYGAWVQEVEQWQESTDGELPDLEDLPW